MKLKHFQWALLGLIFSFSLVSCGVPQSTPTNSSKADNTSSSVVTQIVASATLLPRKTSTSFEPLATPRPSQTPTIYQSPTPVASLTPTLTSTPVPTLEAHSWQSKTVLIDFRVRGGDGCCMEPRPPNLILYSDGRLFLNSYVKIEDVIYPQLLVKKLNRQEICKVLNTIDQTGIYDYDPKMYVSPDGPDILPIDGAGTWSIKITTWRDVDVSLYGLGAYLREEATWKQKCPNCPALPPLPPALRDLYDLLVYFPQKDFEKYQPERLAVRISQYDFLQGGDDWPARRITLEELSKRYSQLAIVNNQELILRGDEAEDVYETVYPFSSSRGNSYFDGRNTLWVYVRPLLPFEAPTLLDSFESPIPAPGFANPNLQLNCSPADGVMAIPTPPEQ